MSLDYRTVAVPAGGGLAIFGNGSDGDETIAGDTTLTRDMFYDNLTVNGGIVLTTDGFRIFVRGTLTNNGTIRNNGATGTDDLGGAGGGGGSLGAGGVGADLNDDADDLDPALGGDGGDGDNLGSVVTLPTGGGLRGSPQAILLHEPDGALIGGGGGGGSGSGGGHGGGSGGGGVICIIAKTLDNSGGIIEANGGDGFAMSDDLKGPGGGGGGFISILSNDFSAGTEQCLAGAGGVNSGSGANGDNGVAGTVVKIANA